MLKIIPTIFLCFLFLTNFGQNIDSLYNVAEQSSSDSVKAYTFYRMAQFYSRRNQLDSASKYNTKSLNKSGNLIEVYYKNKELEAIILARNAEYKKADSLLQKLTKELPQSTISDSSKQRHFLSIYVSLGVINANTNKNSEALDFFLQGVKSAKFLELEGALSTLYNNIGNIYISEEDDSLARIYLNKAEVIYKKQDNFKGLFTVNYNLANIFRYHEEFQDAINTYRKAQDYALSQNDSISYASAQEGIAKCYLKLYEISDQSDKKKNELNLLSNEELLTTALTYYLDSKKILINQNAPMRDINNKIAKVYFYQKQYAKAIKLYSLTYDELDLYSINPMIEASEGLKESYKKINNLKLALEWSEESARLNDTLKARENFKEFGKKQAELEFIKTQEIEDLKYKTEIDQINRENEKKQLIAKNDQRKQLYIIWSVVVSIFLVGFFLIVIIRRWKLTKKQKETIDKQKQVIEKEKQATEDSINYARNIQKAAFPSLLEVNKVIPNNFILFKPKDIVSGDFYWVSKLKDKKIIALGDCTGHGVPGAFMTLISLNILNQIIAEGIDSLLTILEQLHLRLQKRLNIENGNSSKHGLDIAICLLEEGKLTYAGTHIPLYHIRNGSLTEYKGQKFQLGSNDSTMFQQHEILLQKNDSFYISTDGFPDQKGGSKGKKYYYPTLRNKLISLVNLELEEQRKDLNNEFINWKGEQEQLDDVSLIGFKI